MQVTINIEPGQIGETVLELFKNLSQEKKEAMALDVLREWLKTPDFFNPWYWEKLVVADYRSGKFKLWNSHTLDIRNATDDDIRNDYKFQDNLKQYYHPQVDLMNQIRIQTIDYLTKNISKELADCPEIAKLKEQVYKEMSDNFGAMMFNVMVSAFTQNLQSLSTKIQEGAMAFNRLNNRN